MATHGPVVGPPPKVFGCLFIPPPRLLFPLLSTPHPHPRPREWVYPCSTRKGSDKVSGPPWRCRTKRGISCVRRYTHTHIFAYSALLLQPEQGCGLRGGGGGGGGLGADTFLLTITSHTGTHIPTSWSNPPHPSLSQPSHRPASLSYTSTIVVLLPPKDLSVGLSGESLEKHGISHGNIYRNMKWQRNSFQGKKNFKSVRSRRLKTFLL